jgi:hypothetical protein
MSEGAKEVQELLPLRCGEKLFAVADEACCLVV